MSHIKKLGQIGSEIKNLLEMVKAFLILSAYFIRPVATPFMVLNLLCI